MKKTLLESAGRRTDRTFRFWPSPANRLIRDRSVDQERAERDARNAGGTE